MESISWQKFVASPNVTCRSMMPRGITCLLGTIPVIGPLDGHSLSKPIFSFFESVPIYQIGITSSIHEDLGGMNSFEHYANNQGEPADID
jgi:hypothetical protein